MIFEETDQYKMGHAAEEEWANIREQNGASVIRTYQCRNNVKKIPAPCFKTKSGILVMPDMLTFSSSEGAAWEEVKAKTCSSLKRTSGLYEHGFDMAHFEAYSEVQEITGVPVKIIIQEVSPEAVWLMASLETIAKFGEHRPTWPGGMGNFNRRGKNGRGGWLFPKTCLTRIGDK